MKKRRIGQFQVSEIGLGCMNVSHAYGVPVSDRQARDLFARALDLGVDFFDTASLYGFGKNEEVVGAALKPARDKIVLASKGGMTAIDGKRVIDGRPQSIKRDCENSLRRLQTEVIDIYYLHRWDKKVPIEEGVGALSDLIREGKIRAAGLSEVSAATLRRAHAVHPIAALQSEYSLATRNPEIGALQACRELGTAFVAFSPLCRGFLTGVDLDPQGFVAGDFRLNLPRFMAPNFQKNQAPLGEFRKLAEEWGATPARLALAWLLHRAPHIIPIPGTTSIAHLEDDVAAASLALSQDQLDRLDRVIDDSRLSGDRYPPAAMADIDTEDHPAA